MLFCWKRKTLVGMLYFYKKLLRSRMENVVRECERLFHSGKSRRPSGGWRCRSQQALYLLSPVSRRSALEKWLFEIWLLVHGLCAHVLLLEKKKKLEGLQFVPVRNKAKCWYFRIFLTYFFFCPAINSLNSSLNTMAFSLCIILPCISVSLILLCDMYVPCLSCIC